MGSKCSLAGVRVLDQGTWSNHVLQGTRFLSLFASKQVEVTNNLNSVQPVNRTNHSPEATISGRSSALF